MLIVKRNYHADVGKFCQVLLVLTAADKHETGMITMGFSLRTRSSSVVTLARPLTSSSLKLTDRSFHYASPCLWNQLPLSLRLPNSGTSSSISYSLIPSPITSSSPESPLCTSIALSLFHSRLKTYLFQKSYPP